MNALARLKPTVFLVFYGLAAVSLNTVFFKGVLFGQVDVPSELKDDSFGFWIYVTMIGVVTVIFDLQILFFFRRWRKRP
jgi:hypothetical protein